MNQLEQIRTPEVILKDKRGFKIVHVVKCDTGAGTITGDSRFIRLNPMSFPFNGACRIFLTEVAFASAPLPGANNLFANVSLNVSQPYSQSNIPYSATDLLPKNNSIIYTYNSANNTDLTVRDLKNTYIDAVLSPNSIIELNLINESGTRLALTTNDSAYVVHLYIKATNMK